MTGYVIVNGNLSLRACISLPSAEGSPHIPVTRNLSLMSSARSTNGVGTNFGVGVGEARPEGSRAGDGILGEGAAETL